MTVIKHFPTEVESKPQLGLKPLDLHEWIEIGPDRELQLKQKREILRTERATVLHLSPGAEEACRELRTLLGTHLAQKFPELYGFSDNTLKMEGETFATPLAGADALEQIGKWAQEDWALLSPSAPVRLEAACICFPSRWNPASKIGLDAHGIHAPVPGYAAIARPTQNFLERVTIERPVARVNWTIHDSSKLCCPNPMKPREDLTEVNVCDNTWLRIERQTLRRLPESKYIAFSIRTYVHLMSDVIKESEQRAYLLQALQCLTAESASYKGMAFFREALTRALATI